MVAMVYTAYLVGDYNHPSPCLRVGWLLTNLNT